MSEPSAHQRVELIISELLRWGVAASLALLATGTLLCFLHSADYGAAGGTTADLQRLLHGDTPFPRTAAWLLDGLRHAQGQAVIVLGLLLLIAPPVLRVAVSIVGFALEKDRSYVLITIVVFVLLLVSFTLGRAG